jgi:transposase
LKPQPKLPQLSEAEIQALYRQGETAVVVLVQTLQQQIAQLEMRLGQVEGRVEKNSRNSHKPPSAEGFGKQPKSLRQRSQKPSGGQAEHPGTTMEWRTEVDWVETHEVRSCCGCGASLMAEPLESVIARQVIDIAPIKVNVIEHHGEIKTCPHCAQKNQGSFPAQVNNRMQYGSRLKAMMVYLMEGQLLPSERVCQLLSDLLGVVVSEGTLYNNRAQCFEQLAPIEASIQAALVSGKVGHFDETGLRVNGQLWWLHVACTGGLTYYFIHPKRGQIAMDEMNILPRFSGKAMHDGYPSYKGYECEHFLCNAHHLRELQFILEQTGQLWAYQMSLFLASVLHQVEAAKAQGQTALPVEQLFELAGRYGEILAQGFIANPLAERAVDGAKSRGRPKRSPARNLLERLTAKPISVLGFMIDFEIPFDNNQAERDIRMMKLKQKISGGFRSPDGARMFCRIRGYLSTLRKQGCNLFDALIALFSGYPLPLVLQPE